MITIHRRARVKFILGMSPPGDLDGLSHAELKSLVVKQWEEMVELQRTVAAQRDEIARLKGGSGRPNIKPSGMEKATEPKPPGSSGNQRRGRGSTRSKLSIHEERTVKVAAPPRGSRFKGYTSFVVQDLVIRPHVVDFRCERWQTPDGDMMTAPLPAGIQWSFRAGTAPLRAGPIPPGAGDGAATGGAVAGARHRHLQAPGRAPADRGPGRISRRGP